MITTFIIVLVISISFIGLLAYKLHKYTYNPKIDILQTLDGKYIPTVNGKFIWICNGKPQFHHSPKFFKNKKDAENYLYVWLSLKGLFLKSVGLIKKH